MKPKILKRQSEMLFNQNENAAKPTTPMIGRATRLGVVIFLDRAMPAPTTTTIAIIEATMRNRLMSSKSFGNKTMMAAPMIAPRRDLRPPIMIPSKNKTASSLL